MSIKNRLYSHGWLIIINSLLSIAISTRYFFYLPRFPEDTLTITYLVLATLGQMIVLTALVGLITLPTLLLAQPLRRISLALIASLGITLLVIDTFVFSQYRFHINKIVLDLIFSGQIVSFPLITWLIVLCGVVILSIGEYKLVGWLDDQPTVMSLGIGKKFTAITFMALLLSHSIHIWAAANVYQPITMLTRYLPAFYPATSTRLMRKMGWIDIEAVKQQKALNIGDAVDLSYPTQPLKYETIAKPINIVFLVIDSWRMGTFNAENTPALWQFSQQGIQFDNHLSTGNGTRSGIFGLFYGIPSTYWHSFLASHRSPLLIDRLQQLNYEIGVFASAQLHNPEFDQTTFVNIPNLRTESKGDTTAERDENITQEWLAWYRNRNPAKPNFSFLFYDSPHGYDFPKDYPNRYEPMLKQINYLELDNNTDPMPFLNRYKTSVRFVDDLAKQVLDTLEANGELERTLVVITGDHAQELNDNKLNYWGHTSNFTNAQIQVPFILVGAGIEQSATWPSNYISSHLDVVPTIMKNYLGVDSDIDTYSTGVNLLDGPIDRSWVISANYNGYAMVTKDSILEVGTGGQYELHDKSNHIIKDKQPDFKMLRKVLEQTSRFSK